MRISLSFALVATIGLVGCGDDETGDTAGSSGGSTTAPTTSTTSTTTTTSTSTTTTTTTTGTTTDGSTGTTTMGTGSTGGSGSTGAGVCLADADYADAMLAMPQASVMGGGAAIFGAGGLNMDADVLQLELFDGLGVFAGGITTGTFTIQGAELNYETCGVCLRILTDFDGMAFSDDGYLATGGTVDITSVAGNLTYTASNVTFEHVEIDPNTFVSSAHPDMCMSALTSVSFDAVIP